MDTTTTPKPHPTPQRLTPKVPSSYEGPIHATFYSERRRADLHLCTINAPNDTFAKPWDSTKDKNEVTCKVCLRLLSQGTQRWDDEHGRWLPN